MSFQVILAPLTTGPSISNAAATAAMLVKEYKAHLELLFLQSELIEFVPGFHGFSTAGELTRHLNVIKRGLAENLKAARGDFEEWRKAQGLSVMNRAIPETDPSVAWREIEGVDADQVAHFARLADLSVIDRPGSGEGAETRMKLAEGALFNTGRPVLLIPPSAKMGLGDPILVAWNGSAQASRAVAAALPLMHESPVVDVLTAPESGVNASASHALVEYLKWQGIKANAVEPLRDRAAEKSIFAVAKARRAGLVVMGAYSHSKARETVFGGVTREVLTRAELPVLMAH
jgi:nucleotide-binding universal stress UspA family protein